MNDLIILDGIRYLRYAPKSESEFERMVVENAAEIFGKDAVYLDIKKNLDNELGKARRPDGFVLNLVDDSFYIVEVELSTHSTYGHIDPQINGFLQAVDNWDTRRKLATIMKNYIEKDVFLLKKVRDHIGAKAELREYFLDKIVEPIHKSEQPNTVIVIDSIKDELKTAMRHRVPKPKIIEVAIYARDGAESVKAMRFVPQYNFVPVKKEKISSPKEVFKPKTEKPEEIGKKKPTVKNKTEHEALPEKAYHLPLLKVIIEAGGKIKPPEAKREVYKILKDRMGERDYEKLTGGQSRWQIWVAWSRNSLKEKGFILYPGQRGIWEITPAGRKYYEEFKDTVIEAAAENSKRENNSMIEFPISIHARYKGRHFEGKLFSDGSVEIDGVKYKSPSGAGRALRDGKQVNGWDFWCLSSEKGAPSIQEIRELIKK